MNHFRLTFQWPLVLLTLQRSRFLWLVRESKILVDSCSPLLSFGERFLNWKWIINYSMSFRPFDIAKVSRFEKLNGEQFLRYFLLSFNYPTFCLSFDTAKKTIIGELKGEHKKRERLLSLICRICWFFLLFLDSCIGSCSLLMCLARNRTLRFLRF